MSRASKGADGGEMRPEQALLDQLLMNDLSGVAFVRDYLQLQFNPPPIINVYTACVVHTPTGTDTFGGERFANLVIGLVGKRVSGVLDANETLTIVFDGNSRVEIPYDDAALVGPEAFEIIGRDNLWGIWPGR